MFDFGIQGFLIVPVVGKGGVDLAEADVRVLKMEFFRTPTIGEVGGDEFGNFKSGVGNDGDMVIVEFDIFVVGCGVSHRVFPFSLVCQILKKCPGGAIVGDSIALSKGSLVDELRSSHGDNSLIIKIRSSPTRFNPVSLVKSA